MSDTEKKKKTGNHGTYAWTEVPFVRINGPCQVTNGQPVSMTFSTFEKLCVAKRVVEFMPCIECDGMPDEVNIIEIEGNKMTEAKAGVCSQCGNATSVKKVRDAMCCATCGIIRGKAMSNPNLVIQILQNAGCDVNVGDASPVPNDRINELEKLIIEKDKIIDMMSGHRNEIAEIWNMLPLLAGGESIKDCITRMVAESEKLTEENSLIQTLIANRDTVIAGLTAEKADFEKTIADLVHGKAQIIVERAKLGETINDLREQLNELAKEYNAAEIGRVEMMNARDTSNENCTELQRQIESMMMSPVRTENAEHTPHRDSLLLDMVLTGLRGEKVSPDLIEKLR